MSTGMIREDLHYALDCLRSRIALVLYFWWRECKQSTLKIKQDSRAQWRHMRGFSFSGSASQHLSDTFYFYYIWFLTYTWWIFVNIYHQIFEVRIMEKLEKVFLDTKREKLTAHTIKSTIALPFNHLQSQKILLSPISLTAGGLCFS